MAKTFWTSILVFLAMASSSHAQGVSIDFGEGSSISATAIQMFLLVTILSVVPGVAIMVTCFPFVVTVLSILRQAIGLQQAPPNMLIVSLALFLTYFVMDPVFTEAWSSGIQPLLDEQIDIPVAFERVMVPFRAFMSSRIDLETFVTFSDLRANANANLQDIANADLSILVPSFLLSEIERAFEIGFLIFLPFLIIDLVVAAILMSMGMMMVPPAVVSLPFKLAFFVIADGWSLLSEALVRGYF